MEENKYYTPEIDEFFIGFEFEELFRQKWNRLIPPPEDLPNEWVKLKLDTSHSISRIISKIKQDKVRVKSIDKEDLVELGFKLTYIKEDAELIGGFDIHINEQYKILLSLTGENHVFIFRLLHCDDPSTGRWKTDLFDGKIKNKSELIKVLKMLGIK